VPQLTSQYKNVIASARIAAARARARAVLADMYQYRFFPPGPGVFYRCFGNTVNSAGLVKRIFPAIMRYVLLVITRKNGWSVPCVSIQLTLSQNG
jgi:hypothetical protein